LKMIYKSSLQSELTKKLGFVVLLILFGSIISLMFYFYICQKGWAVMTEVELRGL
jgi:hypothetical protein